MPGICLQLFVGNDVLIVTLLLAIIGCIPLVPPQEP